MTATARVGLAGLFACQVASVMLASPEVPVFATDVAPIIYHNCASCHRPGGAGPFALTDYSAVKRRARQITEVTGSGLMPPWLPDVAYGPELEGERGLNRDQIDLLRRWYEAGAPEGDAAQTPPVPDFPSDWVLGTPDLTLELPSPYAMPAGGPDIIRNFVVPVPIASMKSVSAIELQGGNTRVLHHALLQIDRTTASRNREAADPLPGFDGMDTVDGANPDGHFLGWTPGARPYESYPGTEWEIEPGMDLVLQLHLLPSGTAELIQPRIGIYYSSAPSTRKPFSFLLKAKDIDIAPGEAAYQVERRFTTPLPLEVIRVYPHAHYLGRSFELFAILPDERKQPLLHIPDWNFNWQGDYRFKHPVSLPAGATIVMKWVFDNSDDNPRNPTVPAKRVHFGPNLFDEMAEVAIQTLVPEGLNRARLHAAYADIQLREDTGNFHAYTNLALAQAQQGELTNAETNYRKAIELNPRYAPALNNLGVLHARQGNHDHARMLFEKSIQLNPDYLDARHNLAAEFHRRGDHAEVVKELRLVVARNPRLAESQLLLAQVLRDLGDPSGALTQMTEALQCTPDDPRLLVLAGECALLVDRAAEAQAWLQRAVSIDGGNVDARYRLGLSQLQRGDAARAAVTFERLIEIAPTHGLAHMRLGQIRSRQRQQEQAVRHFVAAWAAGDERQRASLLHALTHPRDLAGMAVALAMMGNAELAGIAFARAIEAAKATGDHPYAAELQTLAERSATPRMR